MLDISGNELTSAKLDINENVQRMESGVVTTSKMTLELNTNVNKISVECYNENDLHSASDKIDLPVHCKKFSIFILIHCM